MTKPDNDEYARLMESLQVSIGQVQEILFKMAELFRAMLSSEMSASAEEKIDQLHDFGIGEGENDDEP
jgi:hypothetical protein